MGDRGNIVVQSQHDGTIHFYTHWSGYELPEILAEGLERGRNRWGDVPYLNRILFCEMIKDDTLGETGYGISVTMGDGGTELYVNHDDETVTYNNKTLSFDEFITAHRKVSA